jgi:hypothetical protein
MTTLVWDKIDERLYEYGVDRGVLYDPNHTNGVSWNGLVSVEEVRPGAEFVELHYDEIKYLNTVKTWDFQAVIKAFTMPIEFSPCLGMAEAGPGFFLTRQARTSFGLSYRTKKSSGGYKLHIVYNATVTPSGDSSETIGDSVDPKLYQWTIDARPEYTEAYRPTAHFVIDSDSVDPTKLQILEDILYGSHNLILIDGGTPNNTGPEIINGGSSIVYPWEVPLNGGTPFSSGYVFPTIPPIQEIMEILKEA